MERLTEKRGGQNVIPLRQDGKTKWVVTSAGMGDKSTQFLYGTHANKLADYEDAEEQGLLLRLPCDIGDTIYIVGMLGCMEIEEWEITEIIMHRSNDKMPYFHAIMKKAKGGCCTFYLSEFGKTVFLTKEEAEQKLKEMESE